MASIIKKKKGGNIYYYLAESARVNGKPRIVNQIYLGTAERIKKRLVDTKKKCPLEIAQKEYGLSMALVRIAQKIDFIPIVNSVFPRGKRLVSMGQILLVLAINRLASPLAKRHVGHWLENTALDHLLKLFTKPFSGQNIWSAFHALNPHHIQSIHRELIKNVLKAYRISPQALFYDATNFYTFLDSKTPSKLAQRGYSKEKRYELRIVNLSLLVSQGEQIPLYHEPYPGNKNDVSHFSHIIHRLNAMIKAAGLSKKDVTVTFDRGNNSEDNHKLLMHSKFYFVGGLNKRSYPELYSHDLKYYEPYKERKIYRCTRYIYDDDYTVVVSYHPKIAAKRTMMFYKKLDQFEKSFSKLSQMSKNSLMSYEEASDLVAHEKTEFRELESFIQTDIKKIDEKHTHIDYKLKNGEINNHKKTFGKFAIFTNRHEWDSSQIVDAYFGKDEIEKQFELIKDKDLIRTRPFFHWTDPQIRAHIFVCVLSLLLWNLFRIELKRANIQTENRLAAEMLKEVKLCQMLYSLHGKPTLKLSQMNPYQQRLIEYFENLL